MPTVQPLVININGESESDSESNCEIEEKKNTNDTIAQKVTELLKKTRAEVEAKIPIQPINVNSSTNANESDNNLLEKSVMKLLPKSQQQEYRMLKQKLLNARKKRIRKSSLRKQVDNKKILEPNQLNSAPKDNTTTQKNSKPLEELELIKNERYIKFFCYCKIYLPYSCLWLEFFQCINQIS